MRSARVAGFLLGLLICGVPIAFVFLSLPSIGLLLLPFVAVWCIIVGGRANVNSHPARSATR